MSISFSHQILQDPILQHTVGFNKLEFSWWLFIEQLLYTMHWLRQQRASETETKPKKKKMLSQVYTFKLWEHILCTKVQQRAYWHRLKGPSVLRPYWNKNKRTNYHPRRLNYWLWIGIFHFGGCLKQWQYNSKQTKFKILS